MTYEVQQTRWDRLVRRVSGSIGPGSRVSETISELFPMLNVATLNSELVFLSGWFLGLGTTNVPSVAGEISLAQLFNPAGSGKVVVPTHIMLSATDAQRIEFLLATVPLANAVGNEIQRDSRTGVIAPVVGQIRNLNQPLGIAAIGQFRILPLETFTMQDNNGLFVLAPGTGLTFATVSVAQTLTINFMWRERSVLPDELQF